LEESYLSDAFDARILPDLTPFKQQVAMGVNALDALLFQENLTQWHPIPMGG
jgi:hypothetical protein